MKKSLLFLATLALTGLNAEAQIINTVAGGGFSGLGNGGPATSAELSNPHGLDFDAAGNMYIADGNNNLVRKVAAGTGIITTYAGTGGQGYNGDGIAATSAALDSPWDIALDAAGNLYIGDAYNNRVRKINASTGIISTIAGRPSSGTGPGPGMNNGYNGDGIPADSAKLWHPNGIAVDGAGNVYIADFYNNRIRKVTASTGLISTIAGTGSNAYNGDGIAATTAAVFGPCGVAVDGAGNIYIAENQERRVRKVTASTGLISTIAGNGSYGYSGDGGPASAAQVVPTAITLDAAGNLLITSNNRVRKITMSTGIITTIAGDGNVGFTGDGGPAMGAQFNTPSGIAVDAAGNIYIGDAINNRIRKMGGSIVTGIPVNHSSAGETLLYPNPFSSQAILSFPVEQLHAQVRITDARGREVRKQEFSGKTLSIEKNELPEGIYFISVSAKDGTVMSRKFVIQ